MYQKGGISWGGLRKEIENEQKKINKKKCDEKSYKRIPSGIKDSSSVLPKTNVKKNQKSG